MHNLKKCHNNPNHAYFTSKGCGLCLVENKFTKKINNIKKQKQEPETLRGIEITQMNTEKIQEQKKQKKLFHTKMQYICWGLFITYLSFFAFLHKA